MKFSQTVMKELNHELASLRAHRQEIDRLIEGIEAVLSLNAKGTVLLEIRESRGTRRTRRSMVTPALGSIAPTNGSLRHKLTETLTSMPGSSADQLVRQLERDGFRVGGTTPLGARVSHELSRLRRLRLVRRNRGRWYSVATPVNSGPTAVETAAGA